jgi:hypothetical protein
MTLFPTCLSCDTPLIIPWGFACRLLAGELTRMGNYIHAFAMSLLGNYFSMYFSGDWCLTQVLIEVWPKCWLKFDPSADWSLQSVMSADWSKHTLICFPGEYIYFFFHTLCWEGFDGREVTKIICCRFDLKCRNIFDFCANYLRWHKHECVASLFCSSVHILRMHIYWQSQSSPHKVYNWVATCTLQ